MKWLGPWWAWIWVSTTIITAAVYYSIPAHADPVTNYAALAAPAVCETLDEHPTLPGLSGLLNAVQTDSGFTGRDAAAVVVYAVKTLCPRHIPLLQRFVSTYAPTGQTA